MNNIPTVKEFMVLHFDNETMDTYRIQFLMQEFAKLHSQAALKAAAEKATMKVVYPNDYADSNENGLSYVSAHDVERGGEYGCISIEEESILEAYPETLIQ